MKMMKVNAKLAMILIGGLLVLFSIYFIPSFFLTSFKDVLGSFYDTGKLLYFGYIALAVALFIVYLYKYEVGRLDIDNTASLLELRKETNVASEAAPEVVNEVVTPAPIEVTPVVVQEAEKKPEPKKAIAKPKAKKVQPKEKAKPAPKKVAQKPVAKKVPVTKPKRTVKKAKAREYFTFTFLGHDYQISKGWETIFKGEAKKSYFKSLEQEIAETSKTKVLYPAVEDIFRAFEYTDPSEIKVIIIGKIPWYRKNQADGLAYSSKRGEDINLTSKVIVEEAASDLKIKYNDGSLVKWAQAGVFLINMGLTTPNDKPLSHLDAWTRFTTLALQRALDTKQGKVGLLWGEYALTYEPMFKKAKVNVIKSVNPSPLSAANGFNGSKPFSHANELLKKAKVKPVDWSLK